jgi:glycosyltransferase involved in cell wall biosynthesis
LPAPRRHVTFFAPYFHVYGGGERVYHVLASSLPAHGWTTSVVTPGEGVVAERLRRDGVDVEVVQPPAALDRFGKVSTKGLPAAGALLALPRYWRRLSRVFARNGGVVHTIAHRGVILAGPAARLARVPLLWNVQGVEPSRVVNTLGSLASARVVFGSASIAADMPGLLRRRIGGVVANSVDDALFAAPVPSPGPRPEVFCVSRLTPEKGVDVLVRAAAIVRDAVPGVRVIIIGPVQEGHDQYWRDLRALQAELGLDATIEFTGFLEAGPAARWGRAWAYAQPSHTEGFGLAVAEAMASALPVVATRVGSLAELIDDGRTGLLVPPADPPALAAAIIRLLTNRELATQLGMAARAEAAARFSTDRFAAEMAEVYADMLR